MFDAWRTKNAVPVLKQDGEYDEQCLKSWSYLPFRCSDAEGFLLHIPSQDSFAQIGTLLPSNELIQFGALILKFLFAQ